MPEFIVYQGHDCKPVEVDVDGTWCFGVLRMWTHLDDGSWVADVTYTPEGTTHTMFDQFPAERVRPDTVDRSYGRTGGPPPEHETSETTAGGSAPPFGGGQAR